MGGDRRSRSRAARAAPGGYIGLDRQAHRRDGARRSRACKRAIAKQLSEARLDLAVGRPASTTTGARLLATALGDARRKKFALQLQRPEKLKPLLDAAVKKGRDGGEGAWLLSLELLQWANDAAKPSTTARSSTR